MDTIYIVILSCLLIYILHKIVLSYRGKKNIDNLDIVIYGKEDCIHTQKVQDEFRDYLKNIQYIEMNTKHAIECFSKLNVNGIPAIHSRKTGKIHVGSENFDKIIMNIS